MPKSLMSSPRYTRFVKERNLLLEIIHLNTQKELSKIVALTVQHIKGLISMRYPSISGSGIYSPTGKHFAQALQREIDVVMHHQGAAIITLIRRMRRTCYALAHTGEAEAIGQATNRNTMYSLTADKLRSVEMSDAYSGGSMDNRVQFSLNKLARKIMNAVELSSLDNATHQDLMDRVDRVLPKAKPLRKRSIKKDVRITEADKRKPDEIPDMSQGYIDDATWEQIVEDYKQENVPDWRGPDSVVDTIKTAQGTEDVYAWELEKEVTQDFVYQVRAGQVDAAKENGINDYVWVAVVDSVTDDCCLWRDGLTTKEIEEMLAKERQDDECQTIVPPAHFNCRCVLAPMVDEMPDRPESNEKDFEEWLST